jgi:hypothetical protein
MSWCVERVTGDPWGVERVERVERVTGDPWGVGARGARDG